MKKLLLITLTMVSCANAFGQYTSSEEHPIRLTLLAGAGLSKNTGYYSEGMTSKLGYALGIGVTKPISNAFELQTKFLYEVRRSAQAYSFTLVDLDNNMYDMTDEATTRVTYITLQLVPTYRFGKAKAFFVGAGGYYSMLGEGSVDVDRYNETTGTHSQFDTNGGHQFDENYDAGLVLMVGYTIQINDAKSIDIHITCNKGLVDIHDPVNVSQRFNSINLIIGYRIPGNGGKE
jgi:hypothetical protein